MEFSVIVAYSNKRGIGKNNNIPWYISDDLKHFKFTTTYNTQTVLPNTVVMGKNTWLSLPKKCKPLNDRHNIVLSSSTNFEDADKTHFVTNNLKSVVSYLKNAYSEKKISSKVFIIGGEQLYKGFVESYTSYISKIYVTEVYVNIECDRFFPEIEKDFILEKVSEFKKESLNNYRYLVYLNKNLIKDRTNLFTNFEEENYKSLIKDILDDGIQKIDRTGVGILSYFAPLNIRYDISETFPLCTIRRGFLRGIFEELMLYIRGQTDNKILQEKKITIWDGNTTREFLDKQGLTNLEEGDFGPTYGFNMRHYGEDYINCNTKYTEGIDQLKYVIDLIKNSPTSRRMMINLWDPRTIDKCALPPCLCQYQFNVNTDKKTLNLQIYLRSSDVYLANNWNVCTGAIFVYLICNLYVIELTPGYISVVIGDAHLYLNHLEAAKEIIKRESYPYPKLEIKSKKNNIEEFEWEDLKLIGYKAHPNIKVDMAV